jgi:DNA recombination protein RmuC
MLRTIKPGYDEKITHAVTENFLKFQANIQQTMAFTKHEVESTRREVEQSKDVLSKNSIETFKTLREMESTVQQLIQQQKEAHEIGQSLRYLLQAPKLRGNYGETILEEMLDRILPKGIWQRQYAIDGKPVDAVVIYRDVIIPIDSKFPRDNYERYLACENEAEKKGLWRQYEDALKKQIDSIKTKYIKPEKSTSEFALMFIPSEGIYYETIAEKNYMGDPCALYEYAQKKHVIPVSPNTFYAFLQVVLYGIRNLEVIRSAKKLQEGLSDVERNFAHFYNKFEEIGKNLEKASEAYRVGQGHARRFKENLDSTLRFQLPEDDRRMGGAREPLAAERQSPESVPEES